MNANRNALGTVIGPMLLLSLLPLCGCHALLPRILYRPWTITGRVVDQHGAPVPNVEVRIDSNYPTLLTPWYSQTKWVRTDEAGRFRATIRKASLAGVSLLHDHLPKGYTLKEGRVYGGIFMKDGKQLMKDVDIVIERSGGR